jgi:hypothetical protein
VRDKKFRGFKKKIIVSNHDGHGVCAEIERPVAGGGHDEAELARHLTVEPGKDNGSTGFWREF